MSEFTIDIDKALENAKSGKMTEREYPDALESVRKSVENCEQMAGLDKKVMEKLIKGEWSEFTTLNSSGRSSKKVFIEYDINTK